MLDQAREQLRLNQDGGFEHHHGRGGASPLRGRVIKSLLFFAAAFLICNYIWLDQYFGPVKADQIIFHLQVPMQATSNSFFPSYLARCLVLPALLAFFYGLMLGWAARPGRAEKYRFLSSWGLAISLLFGSLIYGEMKLEVHRPLAHLLGFGEEWRGSAERSQQLEQARPTKNLVLIFLESMEETYASADIFGRNLLSELEAVKEFSFENFHEVNGARWTLAALTANLCGRPATVFRGDHQGRFWPETVCLPDVLAAHGYNLRFFQGGDSRFAGTDWFLRDHHLAPARDLVYYQNRPELSGKIGAPDWGFKDSVLYALAREELTELGARPEPFALIMMTIDTHGVDGFLDEDCPREFDDFRDVVRCGSRMAAEFVTWIKNQKFGPETVIVVVADHQVMANTISKKYLEPQGSNRRLFNTIIGVEFRERPDPDRPMSHLEMLPLILETLAANPDKAEQ